MIYIMVSNKLIARSIASDVIRDLESSEGIALYLITLSTNLVVRYIS